MRRFAPCVMSSAAKAAAAHGAAASATLATLTVNTTGRAKHELQFGDCLLHSSFSSSQDEMGHDIAWVHVQETGCREFELSDASGQATSSNDIDIMLPLSHAVHCPVCLAKDNEIIIPPTSNHWRAGVVVLLECDGHVLLTQRAAHMRSFPSVWVAPGGHIDNGEVALEAAVRELREEVGVALDGHCLQPLAAWGSAFPVRYDPQTPPKRQHFVLYFHATLPSSQGAAHEESTQVLPELHLQEDEVGAHAWVSAGQIEAMLQCETNVRTGHEPPSGALQPSIRSVSVKNGTESMLTPAHVVAHMAHGHVFALQQWHKQRQITTET